MANRRPRLSGIACLQCESRLLQSSANRRFSRFSRLATTPPSLAASTTRPTGASIPKNESRTNGSRYLNSGGIGLGVQAEALAASKGKTTEAKRRDSKSPLSDLVPDDVLIDDMSVEEPLLDETVSKLEADEIWTSLLGDEGEPTEHETFGYIDELQPTDQVILPQATFQDIAHNLSEGFTTSQLMSYVRKNRKPTTARTVYAWENKRRPWVPDTTSTGTSKHYALLYGKNGKNGGAAEESNRITADTKTKAIGPGSAMLLQGYIVPSMTNKEKVVIQLMRECWGVAISEVVESPGRLVVEVRDVEFTLLESGSQTWVREIEAAFSTVTTTTATGSKSSSRSTSKGQTRQSRRIELNADKRQLRVHAPKSVADAMVAEIDQVLKTAATKKFSLSDVARPGAVISAPALKAVAALTGSWVRYSDAQKKKEIAVSWVTPKGAAATRKPLEDTGDLVYRLLLHTFGPSAVVTAPEVEQTPMPTHGGNSVYLDHRPLKRSKGRFVAYENTAVHHAKLEWHDRLGKWARWVEPMLRARVMEAERYATLKVMPGVWSLPFDFTLDKAEKADKKWYETLRCSTVSAFGRVLHEQDHDAKLPVYGVGGTVPPAEPAARVPDVKRVFSAVAPPLMGIKLDGAGENDTIASTTTTVLRFLPGTTASSDARLPSLEVVLELAGAEEGQRPVLSSLRVVTEFSVCDTLFPTQLVDVRTTQKLFFELPAADMVTDADTNPMAPLHAFLEQSALELRNDNHFITTPLHLPKLGLPRAVLGGKQDNSSSSGETIYVDYTFAGAEVRRRVATPYQGWTLGLTNVQTGPGQAQWTELSLEAVPTRAIAADKAAAEVKESFRAAVGDLVHGDAIQWQLPIGQVLA